MSTPTSPLPNDFGIATLSLGSHTHHPLPTRLHEASKAHFLTIDLFDDDWTSYLSASLNKPTISDPWAATPENLAIAQELGDLVASLGMRISCTQPCRKIDGIKDPQARREALDSVAKRFPFMRAFDTDLVFLCANVGSEPEFTADYKTVAADLAELGRMAEDFSRADGGVLIRVGYEGLSWARRNTWASSWEVVRAANRVNVGLIVDSFNMLAVEYADPYNKAGHGRIYATEEESLDVLRLSLAAFVATVPGDRIFFVQLADAELVAPGDLHPEPEDPELLPWSRGHRLFPMEGGYMPVDMVTAAVLATGYDGPLSLEVFNHTLNEPDASVPAKHAQRGYSGLERLAAAVKEVPRFWGEPAQEGLAHKIWKENGTARKSAS